MSDFKRYRKKGVAEMRIYAPGEDLSNVSVSNADMAEIASGEPGGMIARNPNDHADQWYVAKKFFEDNYEQI